MSATKFILSVFSCCLLSSVSAQNLLDDGRRLLGALHTMEDTLATGAERQSAAQDALLILYLYDDPTQRAAPKQIDPNWLLGHVNENALLKRLIPAQNDSMLRVLKQPRSWESQWSQVQTKSREKISTLMYGEAPESPLQYLSVKQTLQRSLLTPLEDSVSFRSKADQMHKGKPITEMPSQQILESLFAFILDRAQQEVVAIFFENLLDKKIPQVGWLFPHVRDQYSNSNYTYSQSFLASLREAFFLDLQNLNVTLPELLLKDEYFGSLQEDPIFFNVLTIYGMFGLSAQEGSSIDEVVPLTHRDLYQRYESSGDVLNRFLADSASTTPEYARVETESAAFVNQLDTVFNQLAELQFQFAARLTDLLSRPNVPPFNVSPFPELSNYTDKPLYRYDILIGNPDSSSVFDLTFLPQLLAGSLNDATLRANNTLEKYDQFFDPPHSSRQLRTAGLELVRNFSGTWYNELSIIDILRRWQADVSAYELALDKWQASFDTLDTAAQLQQTSVQRDKLIKLLGETQDYWSKKGIDRADLQPLVQLKAIAGSGFDGIDASSLSLPEVLQDRKNLLAQVGKRLADFETRLGDNSGSPYQESLLEENKTRPSQKIIASIDSLEVVSQSLRQALEHLDATRAQHLSIMRKQPRPLLQSTELLSNLMYALRSDGQWINRDSLKMAFGDPQLRTACLGLLQQRLRNVSGVSMVSPDATAEFVTLTLGDFWSLQQVDTDTLDKKKRASRQLFNRISVALNVFNRALEFPLFADPGKPGTYLSLTKLDTNLQVLPAISGHCMDFLYYLKIGEHRPAVSALTRMLTSMSKQIDRNNPSGKRARLLRFFEEYGDFVAGIVDARSKGEIQDLLNSLADPPGSSRTKRTHERTFGLNAYLGASVGLESWKRRQNSPEMTFTSVAPSIPIGLTYSKLIGKGRRPQSFSIHLSILDLGAMLTYRLADEDEFGITKITFKNMFKPGFQLQWNIKKTPFYLGTGWQSGAQFRQDGDQEISFRSSRWMFLTFGIDVPIKTFYKE